MQLPSCFMLTIHCHNTQKYFQLTQYNTDMNNDQFWKMGTIAEFQLLVLDSLKYSSKAESPINRSTKAVIYIHIYTYICEHKSKAQAKKYDKF